jgi:hypothetical protein
VPRMADEAAAILRSLAASVTASVTGPRA